MDYFFIENGQQKGPFAAEILVNLDKLTPQTLVWCEGMADWKPAIEVEEIRQLMESKGKLNTTPPPYSAPPTTQEIQTKAAKPNKHWGLKCLLGIIILLLVISICTNPSKESHQDAIQKEVTTIVDRLNDSEHANSLMSIGLSVMKSFFASNNINTILGEMLTYHNYLVCSSTQITINGRPHTVSYGLFGHVFTLNADDVVKAYEELEDHQSTEQNSDDQDNTTEKDAEQSIEQAVDSTANKIVKRVSKRVEDQVKKEINKQLNNLSDSTESVVASILKALGL